MSITVASLKAVLALDVADYTRPLERAGQDFDQFKRRVQQGAKDVTKAVNDIDFSKLNDLGQRLTVGVTAPILGLGAASLKSAADMDALTRGLTAVSGSSEATQQQLTRLHEVAKLPGLGFQEAVQGSINLQAVGFSAEQSERMLKAFGNALATVGKGKAELDGVVLALSQIQSKGKVSAEEINQIAERVPQIRKIMQDAFGTADTEALQKLGIGTEEFINKVTGELEKLPKVTGGIRNDFENFSDAMQQAGVKIGNALIPAASVIGGALASAVMKAADGFAALPPWAQQTTLVIAGVTAAVGPLIWGMGQLAESVKSAREGWGVLVELFRAVRGAMTGVQVAKVAATAATAAQAAAVTAETAAEVANTAAIGANTAALEANAIAAGKAGAARGLLGRLGGMGAGVGRFLTNPYTLAVAAGVGGGYALAAWQDRREGKQDPGLGATLDALNPWSDHGAGNMDKKLAADRAEFAQQRAQGISPAQQAKAAAEAAKQKVTTAVKEDADKVRAAIDAAWRARLDEAEALVETAGEGKGDREAAKRVIPILTQWQEVTKQRAQALISSGSSGADAQKELAQLESEYWSRQRTIIMLQNSAQAEAQKEQEKTRDAQQKLAEQQQKAYEKWVETVKAYQQQVVETRSAMIGAQDAWIEAQLGAAQDNQKDQAAAYLKVPVLQQRAQGLIAEMKSGQLTAKEYWERVSRYWGLQDDIQGLLRSAQREAEDAQKAALDKQADALKEAQEAATRAGQRAQDLAGAKSGLAEAQLRNNPFLNDGQRRQALIPLLVQQFQAMMRPVSGEDELSSLNRQTAAEGVRSKIIENLGIGQRGGLNGRAALAALQRLDILGRQAAALAPITPASASAGDAAGGMRQVVLNFMPGTPVEQILQVVRQEMASDARGLRVGPVR